MDLAREPIDPELVECGSDSERSVRDRPEHGLQQRYSGGRQHRLRLAVQLHWHELRADPELLGNISNTSNGD